MGELRPMCLVKKTLTRPHRSRDPYSSDQEGTKGYILGVQTLGQAMKSASGDRLLQALGTVWSPTRMVTQQHAP